MLIDRLFGWNAATRFGGPLFVHGKAAAEDPDGSAGDSSDDEETGLAATNEDIAAMRGDDEEDELDEENERAKAEARGDSADDEDSESEAATAKRKRFKDHDSAEEGYRELQSHKDRLEQENARLRELAAQRDLERDQSTATAPKFEMNEADYIAVGEQVNEEYLKLPPEKRNIVGATSIMARLMMERMAQVAEQTASKAAMTEAQRARLREEAESNRKAVMKESGLDPELHFDLLLMQRDRMQQEDPNWMRGRDAKTQFQLLSDRTLTYLKRIGAHTRTEVKRAKEEHNREAGATLTGGSRNASRQQGRDDRESDDPRKDSMGADLNAHRATLRQRGTQAFHSLARRR